MDIIEARSAVARQALLKRFDDPLSIDSADAPAPLSTRPSAYCMSGSEGLIEWSMYGTFGSAEDSTVASLAAAPSTTPRVTYEILDLSGSASTNWLVWARTTRDALRQGVTPLGGKTQTTSDNRTAQRIAELQAILGFSLRDLAQVLGVTRQGLYKWLDAKRAVRIQGANRDRFDQVERLMRVWRDLASTPLSSVASEPLESGQTLRQLLIEKEIDEDSVREALQELSRRLNERPRSRSQRLAARGFTKRSKALPSDE